MTYTITLVDLPDATEAQKAELVRLYRDMFERIVGGADKVVSTWLAVQEEASAQSSSTIEPRLGGSTGRWELAAAMARRTALETWPGDSSNAQFEFSVAQ